MSAPDGSHDREVVVVGGGPAGCSAAVFTARYGLDTVVFDRGPAALPRCAYLENYLGFPGGVGVEAFHELMHAHVMHLGGDIVPEMVVSVERTGTGFRVETDTGTTLTTDAVVAAAWYDGSYLQPLDEGEMFEQQEHHGEVEQRLDSDYPDEDGRTPIEGLYVASPAGGRSAQAIVAAGNGAHVARSLIEDHRLDHGYPPGVATEYDWLRQASEFEGEWADRDRWREWFANEVEESVEGELEQLRERYIDRAFDSRLTDTEAAEREASGLERLVEILGPEAVLDAVDEETIEAYLDGQQPEQ